MRKCRRLDGESKGQLCAWMCWIEKMKRMNTMVMVNRSAETLRLEPGALPS